MRGLSLVVVSGDYSSLRCVGFSLRWHLLLQSTDSRCVGFSSCGTWALERRLRSCGARAELLHGMWDLPGPGLEPVSPALAGGFLTTVPPRKPPSLCYIPISGICSIQAWFMAIGLFRLKSKRETALCLPLQAVTPHAVFLLQRYRAALQNSQPATNCHSITPEETNWQPGGQKSRFILCCQNPTLSIKYF